MNKGASCLLTSQYGHDIRLKGLFLFVVRVFERVHHFQDDRDYVENDSRLHIKTDENIEKVHRLTNRAIAETQN